MKKGNCANCGIDIVLDIPFKDGDIEGFKSEDHGCGKEVVQYTFKVVDEEFKDIIKDIIATGEKELSTGTKQ